MRVGIDAHVLGKGLGGVERFLANVVALLPAEMAGHQFFVFVDAKAIQRVNLPQAPNLTIVPMAISNPLFERSVLLPWLAHRHRLDALLVQRLAPWFCGRCKLVVTVHDLTPIKYPSAYPGLTNTLVRLLTGNSVRRASCILTPTQMVADEVATHYRQPGHKIMPFYNGVDLQVFSPTSTTDAEPFARRPYIFTSGAIEARKNLETLLRARAQIGTNVDWPVLIAGGVRNAHYRAELETLVKELGLSHQVRWLGFVDEARLVALYQEAQVFVTPSRDEGFNIPPLEAMACGTPVLCSDIPVHRELFTDAALFFPADSADALALALRRIRDDAALREQLRQQGRARAAHYSWRSTAKRVAAALLVPA